MPYTAIFNQKIQVAELRFKNSATIEEHTNSRNDIIKVCQTNNTNKVLVHLEDLLDQEALSTSEQFDFAKDWNPSVIANTYFAVVMPKNIESQSPIYFIINTSQLDGVRIQPFDSEELAIEWLVNTV